MLYTIWYFAKTARANRPNNIKLKTSDTDKKQPSSFHYCDFYENLKNVVSCLESFDHFYGKKFSICRDKNEVQSTNTNLFTLRLEQESKPRDLNKATSRRETDSNTESLEGVFFPVTDFRRNLSKSTNLKTPRREGK